MDDVQAWQWGVHVTSLHRSIWSVTVGDANSKSWRACHGCTFFHIGLHIVTTYFSNLGCSYKSLSPRYVV
jgi:hypothetical protein